MYARNNFPAMEFFMAGKSLGAFLFEKIGV